jgi:transglutaminase-like putative cysteine protease
MLLKLTHTTDLSYSEPVSESVMELRMAPLQSMDQHRLSFALSIGPKTQVTSYFDFLGNTVHTFSVSQFHHQLKIVATSIVETDRPRPQLDKFSDTWPVSTAGLEYATYDFLQFGGPVVRSPELDELVSVVRPEVGVPVGELALRMLYLIADGFSYEKGITTAASPITEALRHRKGVCQDFAHLMIGLSRAMGIPARYVSGLVHARGAKGEDSDASEFRGATQTHAWCELLFPKVGWVGFDPTNRCLVEGHFVKVAVGRDFRDVSPNKGVFRGKADQQIEVEVHSEELAAIPPELAAERYGAIDIPAYAGAAESRRAFLDHQQQQQ